MTRMISLEKTKKTKRGAKKSQDYQPPRQAKWAQSSLGIRGTGGQGLSKLAKWFFYKFLGRCWTMPSIGVLGIGLAPKSKWGGGTFITHRKLVGCLGSFDWRYFSVWSQFPPSNDRKPPSSPRRAKTSCQDFPLEHRQALMSIIREQYAHLNL